MYEPVFSPCQLQQPTSEEELHYAEPWFHGKIEAVENKDARKISEERLMAYKKTDGTFLVRESNTFRGDYSITFWSVSARWIFGPLDISRAISWSLKSCRCSGDLKKSVEKSDESKVQLTIGCIIACFSLNERIFVFGVTDIYHPYVKKKNIIWDFRHLSRTDSMYANEDCKAFFHFFYISGLFCIAYGKFLIKWIWTIFTLNTLGISPSCHYQVTSPIIGEKHCGNVSN